MPSTLGATICKMRSQAIDGVGVAENGPGPCVLQRSTVRIGERAAEGNGQGVEHDRRAEHQAGRGQVDALGDVAPLAGLRAASLGRLFCFFA